MSQHVSRSDWFPWSLCILKQDRLRSSGQIWQVPHKLSVVFATVIRKELIGIDVQTACIMCLSNISLTTVDDAAGVCQVHKFQNFMVHSKHFDHTNYYLPALEYSPPCHESTEWPRCQLQARQEKLSMCPLRVLIHTRSIDHGTKRSLGFMPMLTRLLSLFSSKSRDLCGPVWQKMDPWPPWPPMARSGRMSPADQCRQYLDHLSSASHHAVSPVQCCDWNAECWPVRRARSVTPSGPSRWIMSHITFWDVSGVSVTSVQNSNVFQWSWVWSIICEGWTLPQQSSTMLCSKVEFGDGKGNEKTMTCIMSMSYIYSNMYSL